MTENRDPVLQSLFAEAAFELDREELAGEAFTAKVLLKTSSRKYQWIAGVVLATFLLAVGAWIIDIPLGMAELVAKILSTELINFESTWLGWFLLPVNNIASVIVLFLKAMHLSRKKLRSAT